MNNIQNMASKLLADYYGIISNNGMQDTDKIDCYNVSTDNLVCPCCNAKLRLIDSAKAEFNDDELATENEVHTVNENKISDYLLEIIENAAKNIYEDELDTEEPDTDPMGNIIDDYNERFMYLTPSLKNIIKIKSNAIANMVKQNGIEISPFYIENEIIQILKSYAHK